MMARRKPVNSREEILDAAQRVTAELGAANLTLDAVARESGLSKGGVLYNFPTKDALLTGMVERLVSTYEALAAQYRQELGPVPNATLRAMLMAARVKDGIDPRVQVSIIAAGVENPDLLAPVRAAFARFHEQIVRETEDPELATLIWVAADGLMFQVLFGVAPWSLDTKDALLNRLISLVDQVAPKVTR